MSARLKKTVACLLANSLGIVFGVVLISSSEGGQTIEQIRKAVIDNQVGQAQLGGGDQVKVEPFQPASTRSASCPDPVVVDLLRHQIAYERNGVDPLNGMTAIQVNVWERGSLTAFYIRSALSGFIPSVRLARLFTRDGQWGGGTCPEGQDWRECVEKFAGVESPHHPPRTCALTIDLLDIPLWAPSPDDGVKRQVLDELRGEIEDKWQGVQEIIIRDLNLKDPQVAMYLKMADGDYLQGCGFRAARQPHCIGWHSFGQAPLNSIRKSIFERPYRLK